MRPSLTPRSLDSDGRLARRRSGRARCRRLEGSWVRRALEVALDRSDHQEVHGDVALVRLALELVVKILWQPHGRRDPLLRTRSARHASTVTPQRGAMVDGGGVCAEGRALLTCGSRCARLRRGASSVDPCRSRWQHPPPADRLSLLSPVLDNRRAHRPGVAAPGRWKEPLSGTHCSSHACTEPGLFTTDTGEAHVP